MPSTHIKVVILRLWGEATPKKKKKRRNPKRLTFLLPHRKPAASPSSPLLIFFFSSPSTGQPIFPTLTNQPHRTPLTRRFSSSLAHCQTQTRPHPASPSPQLQQPQLAKIKPTAPSPGSSPLSADPSAYLSGSTNRPDHSSRPQTHRLHLHQLPPNSPFSSGSSPNIAVSTEPADHKPRPSASVIRPKTPWTQSHRPLVKEKICSGNRSEGKERRRKGTDLKRRLEPKLGLCLFFFCRWRWESPPAGKGRREEAVPDPFVAWIFSRAASEGGAWSRHAATVLQLQKSACHCSGGAEDLPL